MKRELFVKLFDSFTAGTNKQELNDAFSKACILIERQCLLTSLFDMLVISLYTLFLEHLTLEVPFSFVNQALWDGRLKQVF